MSSDIQPNPEWLSRQIRELKGNPVAIQNLAAHHISSEALRRFQVGLSLSDRRRHYVNALCFPLRGLKQVAEDRYLYVNLVGTTKFLPGTDAVSAWCAGDPLPFYGFVGRKAHTLVWFCNMFDCWSVSHAAHDHPGDFSEYAFACGSHGPSILPSAILDDLTDARFPHRVIAVSNAREEPVASEKLALRWRNAPRLLVAEEGAKTWAELAEKFPNRILPALAKGGVVSTQADWRRLFPTGERPIRLSIGTAYFHGRLYLAYSAHREQKRSDGSILEGEVCLVVTSDGHVLEPTETMPIAGTVKKVLRLSDGTALEHWPVPIDGCSWSQSSVHSFLEEKNERLTRPHRSLDQVLKDVERHIRSSVWLPHNDDYPLLALVVACSYAQELFDAVPMVGLVGQKGTGKTELASTLASLGANGCLLQTFTEAAFVGAVNSRRGLVVIDDLEKIAPGRGAQAAKFGHLQQLLKMSYKKATAFYKRCDGAKKEETLCTYGVKVINNTQGIDPIIADRMFEVSTTSCPDIKGWQASVEDSAMTPTEIVAVRDELHSWVFRNVAPIRERYEAGASVKADRAAEIALPLRVLAELGGDARWSAALDNVLSRRRFHSIPALPDRLVAAAIANIFSAGYRHLSTVHVMNEIRMLLGTKADGNGFSADPSWLNSAHIGRLLRKNWTDHGVVERPFVQFGFRLRSYAIRPAVVGSLTAQISVAQHQLVSIQSPDGFCRGCMGCQYAPGCEIARAQQTGRVSA